MRDAMVEGRRRGKRQRLGNKKGMTTMLLDDMGQHEDVNMESDMSWGHGGERGVMCIETSLASKTVRVRETWGAM
jgi:hypothetical protein